MNEKSTTRNRVNLDRSAMSLWKDCTLLLPIVTSVSSVCGESDAQEEISEF